MNDKYGGEILSILNKKRFVKQWVEGKYKEKQIIIYGKHGIGKTFLSEYILKDFITIKIDIESCKKIPSLEDYLKLSLYKKSITMMFDEETRIKALVFDDLKYIQNNDKNLFKQIIDFSKKKCQFPVIYIFQDINNKNIKTIYNNCYPINLSLQQNHIKYIVNKYFDVSNININELIQKSSSNFHSIKINLEFHKENTKQINYYDKKHDDLFEIIELLCKTKNIDDYYRYSTSDYHIISLHILENCIDWIYDSNISSKKKLVLIKKIYHSISIGDYLYNTLYSFNNWELINHIITNSIAIPLQMIKVNKIRITAKDYNRYISRSIIYTYNVKILNTYDINLHILSKIYSLMKNENYDLLIYYIKKYSLVQKVFEKFLKYYYYKIPISKIKKLFKKNIQCNTRTENK
tara:strand:+ start:1987 stop:3204 length:1218 start_codon:yes stop_codon:yes gene_type:complete